MSSNNTHKSMRSSGLDLISGNEIESIESIEQYVTTIKNQGDFTFDMAFYDGEEINLNDMIVNKELSEEIEREEWSIEESEEENPYISVTSFEYQQSKEIIRTSLKYEQSTGPFNLCYEEIYDDNGLIKVKEEIFMLIIKFYEFLENNYYNMLSSEINMILPKKLEIIFNYFENFEIPFIENFNWNGQCFCGYIDIKGLIKGLDNGLGIKQIDYVRINSFGKIFQTGKSPLQPYSPLRPKKVTYDIDYCLEDTLRYTVLNEDNEKETKDFLNSLADESEMENEEKDHTNVDMDTPRSLVNRAFNGNETDGSAEEIDGNISEFSFEDLNEMSDTESVITTDSNNEWRLL